MSFSRAAASPALFPEGVTYAILLMNAFVWFIDRLTPIRRFGTVKGGEAK